jgi:hypothetical protein
MSILFKKAILSGIITQLITLLFLTQWTNASPLSERVKLEGTIVDAQTGEALPAAHLIIKDTYTGTITNADGAFEITAPTLPVTLVARFIGYESVEITVHEQKTLIIQMQPAVVNMDAVIITEEDPAVYIMEKVIESKQQWRSNLNRYKADAYTRQQIKRDTAIVSINESLSELYWDREKGVREILKSKRQTANIDEASNFAGVSYTPNFYDDNLDITGFNMVGITHPEALDYYHFTLLDYNSIDDAIVYEIEVRPKRELQPLFTGTIQVLDEAFALLSVRLKPNEVVVFPPPIQEFNIFYEQQYSNFGGEFWLPVDFRLDGEIEIGLPGLQFPPIGFKQISKLSDYVVNQLVPDQVFMLENTFSVDSTSIQSSDSLFVRSLDVVPLSINEESAYANLDSTASLEKSFQPTGFLAKYVTMDFDGERQETTGDSSIVGQAWSRVTQHMVVEARYNRVDALYAGLGLERRFLEKDRLELKAVVGYSFGYKEWSPRIEGEWVLDPENRRNRIWAHSGKITTPRLNNTYYPSTIQAVPILFGFDDYNDYFRNEYSKIGFTHRMKGAILGRRSDARLYYSIENHSSIDYKTSYDLRASDNNARMNPPIDDGRLSSITIEMEGGSGKEALGVVEANNLYLGIETSHEALGSDWDFARLEFELYQRFKTFYKRRLIPNVLDVKINAGSFIGEIPVQRNGALDAALGVYGPFGVFKTKTFTPYEGASYASLYAEHNFRSIPLEAVGWKEAGKKGLSIIAFGGVGKTWENSKQAAFIQEFPGNLLPSTNGIHSEIGVSLSNIFSLVRLDLAYRLDAPGLYPGISLSRFF